MEVAISHRNQNSTGPRAVGAANPNVGGTVRIEAQRPLVMQQGGLYPLCKKIIGFIAEMRQVSYKSNAKTTSRSRSARRPANAAIQKAAAELGNVTPHPHLAPPHTPQLY